MIVAVIIGVGAAAALLSAGYLIGARRGSDARQELRAQNLEQLTKLIELRQQLTLQKNTDGDSRSDLATMIDALVRQGNVLQHVIEPLVERSNADIQDLRTTLQLLLAPLAQREQLALELANLHGSSRGRADLTQLLDQIAEKGQFSAVLLSDADGLPLAASTNAKELERLAAISALALIVADRIARDGSPAPSSLVLHDEANSETLCRIFRVGDQRLLLAAVSVGIPLAATALDPALPKVDDALSMQ